jgi:hypothetical protein
MFALIIIRAGQVQADVLRPYSIRETVDNVFGQVLSPISKKMRELQQTYKFRTLNKPGASSIARTSQMTFFADGASACGLKENHNIIGRIIYEAKEQSRGWSETIHYSGCDQSITAFSERIEVQQIPEDSQRAPSKPPGLESGQLSAADLLAGRRHALVHDNELTRRYTLYNFAGHPIISILSAKTNEGVRLQIWISNSLFVAAHIRNTASGEEFNFQKMPISTSFDLGFRMYNYNEPSEEVIISQQLAQGTSYQNRSTGEWLSYVNTAKIIEQHLIDTVASRIMRPAMEDLTRYYFPVGETVAQSSCLRNELLFLEAQLRSENNNSTTVQEILNKYFPLWRKTLDSGELTDTRALPCK